MNTKPYEKLLQSLKTEGDLKKIIEETEECFYLDYKQSEKEDYTASRSLKGSDLDNVAKSISGFGNALGGILIFGVDKLKKLKPFKGFKNFESLVQESVSRSTNPHHEKIETISIQAENDERGYIIVIIHQSNNRPLQVITNSNNHRYFYRSGESHIDIPHDVLVGMMGKKIPTKIIYQIQYNTEGSKDVFAFNIILRNVSSVIAKDVWFNMDLGIPNISVLQSPSSNLFTGHNMANSMSIISIKDFRLPPQGYVSPVSISIPKNKLDNQRDYHLYFTFGCEGSKMNEFDSKFKGDEYNKYLDKNIEEFIQFLQSNSKGHIVERC